MGTIFIPLCYSSNGFMTSFGAGEYAICSSVQSISDSIFLSPSLIIVPLNLPVGAFTETFITPLSRGALP